MRQIRVTVVFFLLLRAVGFAQDAPTVEAQEPSTSDPQAVAVLNQALAAGGTSLTATQSFAASGSITYYWAGKEVKGSVLVCGKGTGQFRLDAVLPEGTRSWAVSWGKGSIKEADGKSATIHQFNALNDGAIANPLARIAALANEPGVQISYVGLEKAEGLQVHHVRLLPSSTPEEDPGRDAAPLRKLEVFVDATSFLVVKLQDVMHAEDNVKDTYSRELIFADYRLVNGALMPFSITEKFGGQKTWSLQLDSISPNPALSDSDFKL